MDLKIETKVRNNYLRVSKAFDKTLFLSLSPPFPKVSLLRFDGCQTGDVVDIELNFLLFKQRWTSEVIFDSLTETACLFVDRGIKLPFFLSYWEHEHGIFKEGEDHTLIRDKISFSCPWYLPSPIMYPILYLQFLYRKPIYKKLLSIII